MTTEVAEQPVVKKWTMPHANIGERVVFYTGADRNMAAQNGTVIEVGGCFVSIRVQQSYGDDVTKRDVYHVSDPRLASNPNVRHNGSWEFHPDTLKLRELENRIVELENLVGRLNAPNEIIADMHAERESTSEMRSRVMRENWAKRKAAKESTQ